MEISATGYVVLGILNWEPRSGYEIKQVVDKTTRFFWAASYGQIYPELKRLEEAGLVSGREQPTGGRKRRVFKPTARGRRELERWLRRPPEVFELRSEALLKLFFSSALPPAAAQLHLDEMGRMSAELAAYLREIRPEGGRPEDFAHLVATFGIEMNEWIAEWCERKARELARDTGTERRAA